MSEEKVLGLTWEQLFIGLITVVVAALGLDRLFNKSGKVQTSTGQNPTSMGTGAGTSPVVSELTAPATNYQNPVQQKIDTDIANQVATLPPELRTITDAQTQALVAANALKTYNIQVDATDKTFDKNAGPKKAPLILDLDGFPNEGAGLGGVTNNGVTYTSFLDFTKKTFGSSADPLGLQGWKAFAKSHAAGGATPNVNLDMFWVNYVYVQGIVIPDPSTQQATTPQPQQSYPANAGTGGAQLINAPSGAPPSQGGYSTASNTVCENVNGNRICHNK